MVSCSSFSEPSRNIPTLAGTLLALASRTEVCSGHFFSSRYRRCAAGRFKGINLEDHNPLDDATYECPIGLNYWVDSGVWASRRDIPNDLTIELA